LAERLTEHRNWLDPDLRQIKDAGS
jgi:hypothetical protein